MNRTQGTIVIILLIVILFALLTQIAFEKGKFQNFQVIMWEYRIVSIEDFEFNEKMKKLGDEGWELIFARRALASEGFYSSRPLYECIFKKPKGVRWSK